MWNNEKGSELSSTQHKKILQCDLPELTDDHVSVFVNQYGSREISPKVQLFLSPRRIYLREEVVRCVHTFHFHMTQWARISREFSMEGENEIRLKKMWKEKKVIFQVENNRNSVWHEMEWKLTGRGCWIKARKHGNWQEYFIKGYLWQNWCNMTVFNRQRDSEKH